jgi:fatty-acyl-CoA synthase
MFGAQGELISGDLGHLDEGGRLFLTGRSKDVIIRGAHNIDPSLIEEAFVRHPDVLACAAVGEPDPYAGELPVVFLSLRQGASSDGSSILAAVAPHIFERAAVPKRVTVLDALPTTAIGKIFKPTLRLLAVEQAFRDALGAVSGWCTQLEVTAVSQPSGISAKIRVMAPASRETATTHIQHMLGRMAVPYEVEWL